MRLIAILFCFFSGQAVSASFSILGIFPLPVKSHYIVFDSLMMNLAKRGHNVTVYNTFPKNYSSSNYAEVSLENCFRVPHENVYALDDTFERTRLSFSRLDTARIILPSEESILNCKPLLDLRNSKGSFDLLITETFLHDFFTLYGYILEVPVILMHSALSYPWMSNRLALPHNPSYIMSKNADFPIPTNFLERTENALRYLYTLYFYKFESENRYDRIVSAFYGRSAPRIKDAMRNASMLFMNSHYSLNFARPLVPNVVEVGGINIELANALPEVRV